MRWFDLLNIPKYISDIEARIMALNSSKSMHEEQLKKLEQQLSLQQDRLTHVEKQGTLSGIENDIEKKEPEEIEIGDDYHVPIMNGIKIMYEGENRVVEPKIYGQGSKQKA